MFLTSSKKTEDLFRRSPLRRKIVALGNVIAPNLTDRLLARRARHHSDKFQRDIGLDRLQKEFIKCHGTTVLGGPFAGMRYIGQAAGSTALPKLIGSYELELSEVIERIIAQNPPLVIDVGAAEGYYAVGFALRLPNARIIAFDIDPIARRLCIEMAVLNNVQNRLTTLRRCSTENLESTLIDGAILMSDCEGFEAELLDPIKVSKLKNVSIVVELHEHLRFGVTALIQDRFHKTHDITMIDSQKRDLEQFQSLGLLSVEESAKALNELRHGPQQWAVLLPCAK